MPSGRKLSDQLKREIIAALATRLDVSISELAKEFGLHPITLADLSGKHNIKRPRGQGALCRKNKKQAVPNG